MSELRRFIIRSQVLTLYRQLLRLARRAPLSSRDPIREEIRKEFETHRSVEDLQRIRFLLADGYKRRDRLVDMLGLSFQDSKSAPQR
mmetsp:Transcript_678/g.2259  ORF Transcript_678/g.2259 Transcript_678/m.2259 type:complete len:87 (-) Transcript_678:1265-1525(-)